jgi:hypothetical protein
VRDNHASVQNVSVELSISGYSEHRVRDCIGQPEQEERS